MTSANREFLRGARLAPCVAFTSEGAGGTRRVVCPTDQRTRIFFTAAAEVMRDHFIANGAYVPNGPLSHRLRDLAVALGRYPGAIVVRLDVARRDESIDPYRAIEHYGALPHRGLTDVIRDYYEDNREVIVGVGPGLPIATALALPLMTEIANALRPEARYVDWHGDDFIAVYEDATAARAAVERVEAVLWPGVQLNSKKQYVGAAAGTFNFCGIEFSGGAPHPAPKAIDRFLNRLQRSTDRAATTAGWAQYFAICADSDRVVSLAQTVNAAYPAENLDLTAALRREQLRLVVDQAPRPNDGEAS